MVPDLFYKNVSESLYIGCIGTGPSPAGGQWCPAPHLESVRPHVTFDPSVAAYIQYCIVKMWPPFWFLAPLLLHLSDRPAWVPYYPGTLDV